MCFAACSSGTPQACNLIGADDQLTMKVPPPVRGEVVVFDLKLCQGDRCEYTSFSSKPANKYGVYVEKGVSTSDSGYSVLLRNFGSGWDADASTRLTISGTSYAGRTVLRSTETFHFKKSYPNGKGCEPEQLTHATSVDAGDLTR